MRAAMSARLSSLDARYGMYLPFVGIFLINIIQAGYDVITAAALTQSSVHPTVYAFFRGLGATVLLAGFGLYRELRLPPSERVLWPRAEDVGILIGVGALALAGNIGLTAVALSQAPPSLVAMMAPVTPSIALAIALLIRMEPFNRHDKLSWMKIAGVGVTLAGGITIASVAMMRSDDFAHEARNMPLGIGYLFAAKVCAASYPILQKLVLARYKGRFVAAWMYIFGTAGLMTSAIPLGTTSAYWRFNKDAGLALVYAIVLASAVQYSTITYVNKRLSPVILTASYPLEAIFGPIFAYAFLHQDISLADAVGGGIIIAGLALTVYAKYREMVNARAKLPPSALADGSGGDEEYSTDGAGEDNTPNAARAALLPSSRRAGHAPRMSLFLSPSERAADAPVTSFVLPVTSNAGSSAGRLRAGSLPQVYSAVVLAAANTHRLLSAEQEAARGIAAGLASWNARAQARMDSGSTRATSSETQGSSHGTSEGDETGVGNSSPRDIVAPLTSPSTVPYLAPTLASLQHIRALSAASYEASTAGSGEPHAPTGGVAPAGGSAHA